MTMSMPSEVKTASKAAVNLAPRSRIRKWNDMIRSPRSISRLRVIWVVQIAVVEAVTPRGGQLVECAPLWQEDVRAGAT